MLHRRCVLLSSMSLQPPRDLHRQTGPMLGGTHRYIRQPPASNAVIGHLRQATVASLLLSESASHAAACTKGGTPPDATNWCVCKATRRLYSKYYGTLERATLCNGPVCHTAMRYSLLWYCCITDMFGLSVGRMQPVYATAAVVATAVHFAIICV